MKENERIKKALKMAEYGGIGHSRIWAIDQMVRALTGCSEQEESREYHEWVRNFCNGDDGPFTYEWNLGISP